MTQYPTSRLSSFYQHTLNGSFTLIGRGLHSGQRVTMTVTPGEADTGYCFVRKDTSHSHNEIYALWHNVCDTFLSTSISNASGVRVSSVEHILAALHACGVDNARIILNGPEVPVMDGSALPFVELIHSVGLQRQDEERFVYILKRPIEIRDEYRYIVLHPADTSEYDMSIQFPSKAIGQQSLTLAMNEINFCEQVAAARTFGQNDDLGMLRKLGMIKGGSLTNAVVVQDDKVLNNDGLRFDNECVRHKMLDCIGDMALAGDTILARVEGFCSGHRMNNAALNKMMRDSANYELMPLRMWHQHREDFRPAIGRKTSETLYPALQETVRG